MSIEQKILAVDDRPQNLVALRNVLSDLDVEIVEATSGNDALAATIGNDFALAILDVQMPGMDGYELATHLRSNAGTQHLPIIFLSAAMADEQQMFQGYEAGAVDYIVKPYASAILLAKVRVFLDMDRDTRALQQHRDHLQELVAKRTAAIREGERKLRAIWDNVETGVMLVDSETREILDINRKAVAMIGAPRDAIVGIRCHQFVCPAEEQNCPVLDLGQNVDRSERVLIRADGARVPIIKSVTAMQLDGRDVLLESFVDITERKQAEKRQALHSQVLATLNRANEWQDLVRDLLKKVKDFAGFDAVGIRLKEGDDFPYFVQNGFAEEFVRLENHLACVQDGTVQVDADGRPVLQCTCGLVLSGRRPEGNPLFTANGSFWSNETAPLLELPPDQDPRHEPRNRCIHEGYKSVALVPLRSGNEVIGLLQLNDRQPDRFTLDMIHFFEEIGNSIGVAFTRMRAEAALRTSEEFSRSIIRSSVDCIKTLDLDGRLLSMSEGGQRLLDIDDITEYLGQSWIDFWQADDRERVRQAVAEAANGQVGGFQAFCPTVTGEPKWWDVIVSPIRDAKGTVTRLLATSRDVTERRALENQLRQSQKLESIGTLAGGVAHDFNNLLMGTMNYVELCRDGIAPDHPIRQWLDEITADSQRSANLTRQLLAFARKQTIAPKVLDLNDAIASMLKLLRRLIGEDIDLAWVPGPELGTVKMDPSQIDQVLANLCVNARDAIDGVGKLTIETENATIDADYCASRAEFVPGDYVVLSVSDDGCGMDAETREHIFEPFFTTKPTGEGTGLGLATVYGIVKQNNGFVSVYSEPGKGTTFKIYLPRFRGETVGEADTAAPAPLPGGNETILLVEDEKSIRVTAALFLKAFGYTVLAADCPEQALSLAAEHAGEIHLLITDVVMPGQSGRDLARQLATDRPQMKRLFMSGYTANVIAHRGVLDEGVEFLGKPFTRDELARKVREVLDAEE